MWWLILPAFFLASSACAASATATVSVEIVPAIGLVTHHDDGHAMRPYIVAPDRLFIWVNGHQQLNNESATGCTMRCHHQQSKHFIVDMP